MSPIRDGEHIPQFERDKFFQESELHHVSSNYVGQGLTANADDSIVKMNTQSNIIATTNNEGTVEDEIGVRQCFVDFCRQTILHGWHYLIENGDSSDSESDKSDIICPPTPKECSYEKRGHYPNQCSCHHVVSAQNSRNKHIRHSTNKARNHSKRPYHPHQSSTQSSVSRQKIDKCDDLAASNTCEENGTMFNIPITPFM